MISNQQCNHIARKYGLDTTEKMLAALKEAFNVGRNYDVVKVEFKAEGKVGK